MTCLQTELALLRDLQESLIYKPVGSKEQLRKDAVTLDEAAGVNRVASVTGLEPVCSTAGRDVTALGESSVCYGTIAGDGSRLR